MVLFCLLTGAAIWDVLFKKIPNWLTASLAVGGILQACILGDGPAMARSLAMAGAVLLLLFPFFSLGGLGAGDVKLLSGIALYMAGEEFLRFVFRGMVLGLAIYGLTALGRGMGRLRGRGKNCGAKVIGLRHRIPLALPFWLSLLWLRGGWF